MSEPAFRVEITLSSLTYRGDRDERLTELFVKGEGSNEQDALYAALRSLATHGYHPVLLFQDKEGAER